MKIVIPTNNRTGLDDTIAEHFGRCKTYTFVDENGKVIEIMDNTSVHTGGKELPPEFMKRHGADILLCRELGPRALDLCKKLGIEVYVYQAKTVEEIFDLWKNKKLKKASFEDICEAHKT